ncbi:hypothetical protein [uncultured Jannaschia sp.]|uniref:hypothetical protein n=1 Tax=uncultured Jannaschia sp. TaxID=293347 RepID=UPI002622D237|nr:hypothetical protein [uncultured Jannaschia sp.]
MNALTPIKSAWKSVQLLIAFHRNKDGRRRQDPRLWSPKNGVAGVTDDPNAKESVLVVRGHGDAGDVQIKLHPDKIILRRDPEAIGWSGLQVDHYGVRVLVGDVWITVQADGSIKREIEGAADDESWLEADGSYIRIAPEMEINVAGDGSRMTRRTKGRLDMIDDEGSVSRRRKPSDRPLVREAMARLPDA